MIKQKNIKTKFFLTYGIALAAIVMLCCIFLILYIFNQTVNDYHQTTSYEVDTVAANVQELYANMDYMVTFLLSDSENLISINYLSRPIEKMSISEKNKCLRNLRQSLYSYCIDKYFYRVCYYNNYGIFASSNYQTLNALADQSVRDKIDDNSYYNNIERHYFYGKKEDIWDTSNPAEVVGMIRRIKGNSLGYIEIQVEYDQFATHFERPFTFDVSLCATLNGEYIYSSFKDSELQNEIVNLENKDVNISHKDYTVSYREYSINGDNLIIYYTLPTQNLFYRISPLLTGIVIVMLAIVILSLWWMFLYSKRMVSPINHLKEQMDITDIENLNNIEANSQHAIEEITHLYKVYNRLIDRIRDGRLREKALEELQMRTNLDALQAQVNPHFINNTLNVISYRGALLGDDEICEICSSISMMLKYSTNTKRKTVEVKEELEYVENYVRLLQYRYGDKFSYEIKCDERIHSQKLPKVVIQQLVENSIMHAYRTPYNIMEIKIIGWVEGDSWYIKVSDNGDGFEKSVLEKLMDDKKTVRQKIIEDNSIQDMEIGGMGLINTYSRMLLIHDSDFNFDLYNDENGAVVVLGIKMEVYDD